MKKVKLLILIHSLDVGGAEGQVYELAAGLDKSVYDVTVCALTGQGAYIQRLRAKKIRVVVIADRLRQIPWKVHRLIRLIHQGKFDIVQNFMFTAGVLGTITARACRVPIVVNGVRSLGFLHYRYRIPIKRLLYRFSDCIIVNSQQTASLLVANCITTPDKVHVIYNGVDTEKFRSADDNQHTAEVKQKIGIQSHAQVVGIVANLAPVKNHESFLKAIPVVLKQCSGIAFIIVGNGGLRTSLEQLARSLGISENVFFWVKEVTPLTYTG
jgi:glycosyltransferase involved in cell wall biosynthesis